MLLLVVEQLQLFLDLLKSIQDLAVKDNQLVALEIQRCDLDFEVDHSY
jgi:hypothetical protein